MLMHSILSMAGSGEHGTGLIDQTAKFIGYGWLAVIGLPETLAHVINARRAVAHKRHKVNEAFEQLDDMPNVKVLEYPTIDRETDEDYRNRVEEFAHLLDARRIGGLKDE